MRTCAICKQEKTCPKRRFSLFLFGNFDFLAAYVINRYNRNRMIRAVIFDMDGVIVDSTECDFLAWKRVFDDAGVKFSRSRYKASMGKRGVEVVKACMPWEVGDEEAQSFQDKKLQYFMEECIEKKGIKMIEGIGEFVELVMKNDYQVALATAAVKERAEVVLEFTNLKEYFPVVVAGDQVSKGKPDPETFLKAAEKLGRAPEECVVIEDAPNGVRAAKAGGMKCIAITTTHSKDELGEADKIIDSFDELTEFEFSEL